MDCFVALLLAMTVERLKHLSAPRCGARSIGGSTLDLGKIRDRARGAADFVDKLQAVLAHFWIVVVDLDLVEEGIHRRTQLRHRGHRAGKILFCHGATSFLLRLIDRLGKRLLFSETIERGIRRAVERPLVLLLFDRKDIARALGAREQILAVVCIEEFSERLDAANYHQQIVLALEREHGIDEIMTRALLAKLDFQAVGEEGLESRSIQTFHDSFDSIADTFTRLLPLCNPTINPSDHMSIFTLT